MQSTLLDEIKRLKQTKVVKQPPPLIPPQKQVIDKKEQQKGPLLSAVKKNTIRDQIMIDKASIDKPIAYIFSNLTFCIPIKDVELTPAVIKNLTNIIEARKGVVIEFHQKMQETQVNFLLCSRRIDIVEVEKKMIGKLQYQQVLYYMFIRHCISRDILLNTDHYIMFKGMTSHKDQDKQKRKIIHSNLDQKKDQQKIITSSQQQEKCVEENSIKPEESEVPKKKERLLRRYQEPKKQDFACHVGNKGDNNFSMNNFICEELSKFQRIYENQKDLGRKIAYMKAVSIIKSLNFQIQSQSDLSEVKGIGKSIREKIKELLETGHLQKLEAMQMNQKTSVTGQLTKVWGIGPSKALQLFNRGINSIEELKDKTQYLNKNQRIGLKYHEDFQIRIPRDKVTRMFEYIKKIFYRQAGGEGNHKLEVCGSYRRNKPTCGDMDLIITRTDGLYQKKILVELVDQLEKEGFLTDNLSLPRPSQEHTSMSFMGVCRFEDQTHHRIDIKYYPVEQFSFAILYFTGSDFFNRSMRLFAKKKGYILSDHGIEEIERNGKIQRQHSGQRIICYTEEQIFSFLGLDFKTPEERSV